MLRHSSESESKNTLITNCESAKAAGSLGRSHPIYTDYRVRPCAIKWFNQSVIRRFVPGTYWVNARSVVLNVGRNLGATSQPHWPSRRRLLGAQESSGVPPPLAPWA